MERNECVILPGLGGFVTTHIPARYDEKRELFFPPYRILAFQAGLTTDDGLLAQSFMESDDLSYPDAVSKVCKLVDSVKADIMKSGYYKFDSLGQLSRDVDGNYHFSASQTATEGISSPEFYGLMPVSIMCLTPDQERRTPLVEIPVGKAPVEEQPYPFYPKKGISIHLSTSTLNKIAGIVVMFLLVFLFATPFGTLRPVASYSGFAVSPDNEIPERKSVPAQVIPKNLAGKTFLKNDTTTQEAASSYCIVLASGVTNANGDAFIHKLSESGIKAFLLERGKMKRVVYSSFKSKEEAQDALRKLRQSNDIFATAWVMKK